MTQEELDLLLPTIATDFDKVKQSFEKEKTERAVEDFLKQYEPVDHDVLDTTIRPDKPIDGGKTEKVNRLAISMQKLIVQRAASFLCANPIQLHAAPEDEAQKGFLEILQKTWDDNKLDYKSMELAEKMMAQTEVAELWYMEELDPLENYWAGTANEGKAKFRMRMRILSHSAGDTLLPVFDPTGNLIAFGRLYKIKVAGQDEEHFDVYTAKQTIKSVKNQAGVLVATEANVTGKIPVIYYEQEAPEWKDVQGLIDRLEAKLSNHADTNDYFDSPILFVEGEITNMAKKGDSGKIINAVNGAKASYIAWESAPESTKMEIENLFRLIYTTTDTPDISFQELKGMGTTSGFALKMMFMGAHLKAARKEAIFGECIQRRINYLKTANSYINLALQKVKPLTIKPKFEYFLPKNEAEKIDMLNDAVSGGIMSQETAIKHNPLVEDYEAELTLIEKEKAPESEKLNDVMNEE